MTETTSSTSRSSRPAVATAGSPSEEGAVYVPSRLNPTPDDYSETSFADKATLTVHAGAGGHGCISFLRDLFLPEGPPNGGDGGHGGHVYIQAVPGETSLHKIARRRVMRAGRGKHGQGSACNGQRGDDVIISVPVGTIVTEVSRTDPVVDDIGVAKARYAVNKRKQRLARAVKEATVAAARAARAARAASDEGEDEDGENMVSADAVEAAEHAEEQLRQLRQRQQEEDAADEDDESAWLRRKWVVYPGLSASEIQSIEFPRLPRRERVFIQPAAPIYLDLSRPTPQPILLASGGVGGLGNPHFLSRKMPRPVVATKGDAAVSMTLQLELKLLADVGLVGLPNAGKSTLLRALSNSRARVGAWAFTTLQPNIGTVVLDNNRGRPVVSPRSILRQRPSQPGRPQTDDDAEEGDKETAPRTRFTVADIPGLIEGAHLDKGLGIAFLRHVERAGVLAFVIDLGAGDAVAALKALWKEVGLYARLREEEEQQRERDARIEWLDPSTPYTAADTGGAAEQSPAIQPELAIAGKPWFVVGTKGDLPGAEENFARLRDYLSRISSGDEAHPSEIEGAWTEDVAAIPISAIHGHGVDHVVHWTVGLLEQ